MPTSTSVKYYHSAMAGAPVLSGVAGTGIAVLDILVNGFGLQTASSLVVAGGIATLTLPTGHSFEQDTVALVAGATPAELNGEKRIISTTTNTATFDATGISNQTATGTITAKVAGAGWDKAFTGTNVAAYRAQDITGTRMFLRVDDTSATNMRVVGYENMTDVNTGTGPFPTAAHVSGGGYWPKANASGATARAWTLVADGKEIKFHIHTASSSQGLAGCVWRFGDFAALKSGDAYACALQCATTDIATSTTSQPNAAEYCASSNPQGGVFFPRSFTALGGGVLGSHLCLETIGGSISGSAANAGAPVFPNGPDNGMILSKKIFIETSICRRGYDRGFYITPQLCHASFSWRDKVDGQGDLLGRKLLAIKCGAPAGTASAGVAFVDIIGPW